MGQIIPPRNTEDKASPSRIARAVLGSRRLAELCERTTEAIRKWDRPRSKGGTGGLIPSEFQARILRVAEDEGLPLGPRDLIGEAVQ